MAYWLMLARPGWVAGVAAAAIGLAVLEVRVGLADDVAGTITAARFVAAVLSVGVAAAFLDTAGTVLDATPYPRWERLLTPPAVTVTALALVAGALALTQMTRVEGVPWSGVLLQASGVFAIAVATGAACRGRADAVLIAAIMVVGLLTLDARAPWGPILTAPPAANWLNTHLAWACLTALATAITFIALRDPAKGGRNRIVNRPVSAS